MLYLWVVEHLGYGIDGANTDVFMAQKSQPVVSGALPEEVLELVAHEVVPFLVALLCQTRWRKTGKTNQRRVKTRQRLPFILLRAIPHAQVKVRLG